MSIFSKLKPVAIFTVVIVSLLLTINNFVDLKMFKKKINLGLDLQGGSHLLLKLDMDYYLEELLTNDVDALKTEFRNRIIKAMPKLTQSKTIEILFREKPKDLKKIIADVNEQLEIKEEDKRVILSYKADEFAKNKRKLLQQTIEIIRRRIDETGTREPVIQVEGTENIVVQVAGLDNPEELKNLLGRTAKLTFHLVDLNSTGSLTKQVKLRNTNTELPITKKSLMSGELLTDATMGYYQGKPIINFKFNAIGAKKFAEITKNNMGQILAIVLDDEIITAPRIGVPILNGAGMITGDFTEEEALQVALLLRAGSLPAPLEIIEERTVGPSLGRDLIRQGIISCSIGAVLIMLYLFLAYRKLGVFANMSLIVNITIILATTALFDITLTLPGIAGIVLTMGMAVDANVLVFERIREEYKSHGSVAKALENGFDLSMTTIMDSNLTTVIVGIILYMFGSGPVKGFAVVLNIGIFSSIFATIIFTKYIMQQWITIFKVKKLNV